MSSINFLESSNIISKGISTYGSKIDNLLFLITLIILPVTIIIFFVLIVLILKGYLNKDSQIVRVKFVTKFILFIDFIILILDLFIFNFTLHPWNVIQGAVTKNKDGTWTFPAQDVSSTEEIVKNEDVLEIRVEGKQFSWDFYYPGKDNRIFTHDDLYLGYALHIPVDTKIVLRITSLDVIHSLWLRSLRFKQDAIPGRMILKWFQIDSNKIQLSQDKWETEIDIDSIKKISLEMQILREQMVDLKKSDYPKYLENQSKMEIMKKNLKAIYDKSLLNQRLYEIICAEICGNSHYSMNAWLIVHTKEIFKKWMDNQIHLKMNEKKLN